MPPACHAPYTSMYLDQHGDVRACCMNVQHVLGNITDARLPDIWHGEPAAALRRAMDEHDLGLGCDMCRWQVDAGHAERAYARWYDIYPVGGPEPDWPQQLELSVSNTCNLQCVMCNGEWSSSIRAHVEGRPPLPAVYDDRFFADLGPFLPHLERVKFLGGEPFLATETLRVMEMLVDQGLTTRCHVTTNGTQWTPRVERILSLLPVDVTISLDAATAATYESIRRGSSWEAVRCNVDRFVERAQDRNTFVSLTFCLMTVNWHEFGSFCRLADEIGVMGDVNTVVQPPHLSLFELDTQALADVVAGLDARDEEMRSSLGLTRSTWITEVGKLRSHLAERHADRLEQAVAVSISESPSPSAPQPAEAIDAPRLALDEHRVVRSIEPDGPVLGIPAEALRGLPHHEIRRTVEAYVGPIERVVEEPSAGGVLRVTVHFEDGRAMHLLSVPSGPSGAGVAPTHLYWAWEPLVAERSG